MLDLNWEAPAACPGAVQVKARAERLAGGTAGRKVKASGRVTQIEDGWKLLLRTEADGIPGERELRAPDCSSLAAAAAMILAWMLDPEAKLEATPPPSAQPLPGASSGANPPEIPSPPGEEANTPEAPVAPAALTKNSEPPRLRGWVALGGATVLHALPGWSAGPSLEFGGGKTRWSASLEARWFAPRHADAPAHPTAGVRVGVSSLGGKFCGALLSSAPWAMFCGSVGVLRFSAQGEGVREPLQNSSSIPFSGLEAQARWPVSGSFWLLASGGAAVPWRRPSFVIDGVGEVFHTPALGGEGRLALGWWLL